MQTAGVVYKLTTLEGNDMDMNKPADWLYYTGFIDIISSNGKIPTDKYKRWLDEGVPLEIHEHHKRNHDYEHGIMALTGRMRRYLGEVYFVGIDLDNSAAIEEFCNFGDKKWTPEEMAATGQFLVDQTADKTRLHVYFHSKRPYRNLAPYSGPETSIPKIEVKCERRYITIAPSPHSNGSIRQFLNDDNSMAKFVNDLTCLDNIENHIDGICKKYGLVYLNGEGGTAYTNRSKNKNKNKISINDDEIFYEGARHLKLYAWSCRQWRIHRHDMTPEQITELIYAKNTRDCRPPLPDTDVAIICKNSREFIDQEVAKEEQQRNTAQGPRQQNKDNGEEKVMSVLEAKKLHVGEMKVIGTIVSVSQMYVLPVDKAQGTITLTIDRNAKSIQLEDADKLDENERLDAILFDDMIDNVRAGELVKIEGNMELVEKKSKSKIKNNVLYATSIKYLNRKELVITEDDIEAFDKFVTYRNLLERLVAMFAPNIIGHDDVKRGLLRAIVGGIDRGKESSGRLDTLMPGDIGTAKSKLGAEAAEVKPNSRHVSAPFATTKTITAVPERINEMATLVLGAIPLSSGALCAIDEINMFSLEDQGRLLDIMENGSFDFDKMGIRRRIPAPTTIIATANPVGGNWKDPQVASKDELELRRNLIDRFTQIYSFRDTNEEEQIHDFAQQMDQMSQRRPHNYNFLRKYLMYASSIKDVKFTKEARTLLSRFWAEAKVKGLLSYRMYKGLYKIAEAQAKLQLKTVVDTEIAEQTMDDMREIMVQYGQTVGQITSPHEIAYKTCLDILRSSQGIGMTIEAMCEIAVKTNDEVALYLGYIWKIKHNHKLRSVIDALLNHPNVKRIGENPIVIQFLSDVSDVRDMKTKKIPQTTIQNRIIEDENKIETASLTSPASPSILEKDDRKPKTTSDRSDTSDSHIETEQINIDLELKPDLNPENEQCAVCGEVGHPYYISRHKHEPRVDCTNYAKSILINSILPRTKSTQV